MSNLIVWLPLILELLGNMCIEHDQKSSDKNLNILRTKKLLM